jgi:hypothetical protein
VRWCSFLALLDTFNFLGGRNPTLRADVVNGRLRTLTHLLTDVRRRFIC